MRIALGIEYDGTAYVGWQRQHSGPGIQASVEAALAAVADEPVEAVCAGRTDTGVHATGQVVHFDTRAARSSRGWLLGINANLPADVNATWATPVADDFHARFSALSRTYRYLILNRLVRSALFRHRAWWVHESLDVGAMQAAADHLLGEHDFSAFRASGCQAATATRHILSMAVRRSGPWVSLTVTANAFLQHMVRNITGSLVAVGRGDRPPGWVGEVLRSGDRRNAGAAAPAHGLTLAAVSYPDRFGVPAADADTSEIYVYDARL